MYRVAATSLTSPLPGGKGAVGLDLPYNDAWRCAVWRLVELQPFLRLTRYAVREVALMSLLLGVATAAALWLYWPAAVPLLALWAFGLAFFRDPRRRPPQEPGLILAPADGTVTEVTSLPDGRAKIGVFLSILNVHVNRSPCAGRVADVAYSRGRFRNALNPASADLNESNTVTLTEVEGVGGAVAVRQIAGLLARRIVCGCRPGERLERGQRFGMIKFGSRTELYLPLSERMELTVRPGDRVKAGLTVVARPRADEGAR